MGIEKIRRRMVGKGGFTAAAANSLSTINVASRATVYNMTVTGAMSLAALTGVTAWRGKTNIASGKTIKVVAATGVTSNSAITVSLGPASSVASQADLVLSVNSINVGTGFCVVANLATVDTQPVSYIVLS